MKKYLQNYIKETENLLKKELFITDDMINKHLEKIKFFQHERLVHLIVTMFYALFTIIFIILSFIIPLFFLVDIIMITVLLFYVLHYFFLENNVQYLYVLYDRMLKKRKKLNILNCFLK